MLLFYWNHLVYLPDYLFIAIRMYLKLLENPHSIGHWCVPFISFNKPLEILHTVTSPQYLENASLLYWGNLSSCCFAAYWAQLVFPASVMVLPCLRKIYSLHSESSYLGPHAAVFLAFVSVQISSGVAFWNYSL